MIEEIINESNRCLNCKNARCMMACPLINDIPLMLAEIREHNFDEAFSINQATNPLGAICGIVCPHEKLCEGSCIQGIISESVKIGKIESSLAKHILDSKELKSEAKIDKNEIAIIGGGPAGLSLAYFLSKNGISSTIFEKENFLGGILIYGIPDFRLDKELVTKSIDYLTDSPYINIKLNHKLVNDEKTLQEENDITINQLKEQGYKYIVLAIGDEISTSLDIENIDSKFVIKANDFLRKDEAAIKELLKEKKVAVVGGGNVAIDCSRLSNKLGAKETTIVYRRLEENMPANLQEINEAKSENIKFLFKRNITSLEEQKEPKTGIIAHLDTGEDIEEDYLILAIGYKINKDYVDKNIEIDDNEKCLIVNDNFETSIENVYAIGDIATNKGIVVNAIKNGKDLAKILAEKIKT